MTILNNDTSHGCAENWTKWFGDLAGKPGLKFLEIGSWEGASARWFLSNILTEESCNLICVDTFAGGNGMPVIEGDEIYGKFVEHLEQWMPKIHIIRERSQLALRSLNREIMDLVFIDGSHRIEDVLTDSILSWCCLKAGGLLIWDDYELKQEDPKLEPRVAIDTFLSVFKGGYELVAKEYQVCIRKNKPDQVSTLSGLLLGLGETKLPTATTT